MKRHLLPFLLALPLCASCLPRHISGARAPTEHTFRLTAEDLRAAETSKYIQDWVTGDAVQDLETAKKKLDSLHVKVREGNPSGFQTALPGLLWVERGFKKKPIEEKVYILSHELVHYEQLRDLGIPAFADHYANSPGRYRVEVPAYAQTFRSMLLYCVPASQIENAIEKRIISMRDSYWLHDIDPEQYELHARRIWRTTLNEAPNCD